MSKDARFDAQIAAAPAWAADILTRLRTLVHQACPEATEDIKWGRPFFLLGGKPFAMMAHFKAHAVFGFWRMGKPEKETEGGGQYGKLTALADLPPDAQLLAEIAAAAEQARAEAPAKRMKSTPKPALGIPADLAEALAATPTALAGFEALPPGARREYLEWIVAAKRPETRTTRIARAVAQCAEGRKLNWKYENC